MIIGIFVPFIIGYALISLLWPTQKSGKYYLLLKCAIAIGLGHGLASVFLFVILQAGGSDSILFYINIILILAAFIWLYLSRKRNPGVLINPDCVSTLNDNFFSNSLQYAFVAFFLLLITIHIFSHLNMPHGDWDAWAIWNLRARFIFRAGPAWNQAFSTLSETGHLDYPLFLPLSIVYYWKSIGSDTPAIPALISSLFTVTTVLLLFSSLAILRGKTQALIAGIALMGSSFFLRHGSSQCADTPLSFFFLATVVLLVFHRATGNKYLLFLAGTMAGLSAWTKNEGLLFMVVILMAWTMSAWRSGGIKEYMRNLLPFGAGIAWVAAFILFFKVTLAPQNDLMSVQNISFTLARLTSPERYIQIAEAFITRGLSFTSWIIGVPLLIPYFFVFGRSKKGPLNAVNKTAIIAVLLILAGYFMIYVITPVPLQWHLKTSINRLFIQLWPMFLFWFFMTVRTPAEYLSEGKK